MIKKILVVMGGFSNEREVSLVTGQNVVNALKNEKKYQIVAYDLTDGFNFVEVLKKEQPDVVFNALHGNFGEDGEIQGLLDILQIPYTHSGLKSSILGMDKNLTKSMAAQNGIKIAASQTMTYAEFRKKSVKIEMPYVVKPVSDGSSVGVFIVKNEKDKKTVFYEDDKKELLIEKFIEGKELTVSVLNGKALAVTELRPKKGFYDYNAKYTDGMTQHILPAEIPENIYRTALKYAEKVHKILDCNTISRCDFRYNEKDGVVLLEVNTNPGLTSLSLVPEQAKFVGISYAELCKILIKKAKCRGLKE